MSEQNAPTTGEIVRELETLLPPMTNYAESVCAEGAFAHSTYMVWDDPEPYIIKNGIDRLKSQEQTIAALTARAEQAERERDAARKELDMMKANETGAGLCLICKKQCSEAANGCFFCKNFEWRGLPQDGEGV